MAGTTRGQPARRTVASPQFGALDVVTMREDDARRIELCVDKPRLRVVVCLSVFKPPVDVTMDVIADMAKEAQLLLNSDAMKQIQDALTRLTGIKQKELEALLFEGRRAEDGRPGCIEWLIDYDNAGKFSVDERGRADYRNLNTIVNVPAAQKLLLVRKPTKGVPGLDVFGGSLPARDGEAIRLRRGRNVSVEETADGALFVSDIAGMVAFDKDMLAVEAEVAIAGDVDLSVGNIDFTGPITVGKGVLDGFSIRGGAGVAINGLVEGATIESAGDLACLGGVQGKLKGSLTCHGKLTAKYFNEVTVHCDGDIVIAKSVVNTKIRSLGKVVIESEGVVGSDISALCGLETPVLGSDLCVPTEVVVGVHYQLQSQLDVLRKERDSAAKEAEKLQYNIGPYLANPRRIETLVPKRKEKVVAMIVELRNLIRRRDEIQKQTAELEAELKQRSRDAYVSVAKMLYGGVTVRVGPFRRLVSETIRGPLKLTADYRDGVVAIEKS